MCYCKVHLLGRRAQKPPAPQPLVSACLEQSLWQSQDLAQPPGYSIWSSWDRQTPEEAKADDSMELLESGDLGRIKLSASSSDQPGGQGGEDEELLARVCRDHEVMSEWR